MVEAIDGDDHEITALARQAVELYGPHAADVLTVRADELFCQGALEAAFIYRLIVFKIADLEA